MIAEDGQGMISQGTGGNVEHARQQLAGDLVHVGDHQQQALGCGVGGGQRAALKGAVYRAGGAGFRLHFRDLYLLAEQVQLPFAAQSSATSAMGEEGVMG